MGQSQPRVIVLPYTMLHTKFQGHWSIGSGEEDFFKVFTIYGHDGHVGHDPDHLNNFSFLKALEAVYEIWLQSAQQFQRRSCLKLWTDDRQMTELAYTISSPGAFGSGELTRGPAHLSLTVPTQNPVQQSFLVPEATI